MSRLPTRYAGWMIRDLALGPGIVMAGLAVIAVAVTSNLQVFASGGDANLAACMVVLDWTVMAFTLMATGGIVSEDFALGHQRTLFAKPLSPTLYYLERWLLGGGAVLVATTPVAYAIARRFDIPLLDLSFVARVGLEYLVLGGLVLLLSTLVRRDWLLAVGLLAWQMTLDVARSVGAGRGLMGTLLYALLPPFQLARLRGPAPAGADLLHVLCYGVALLLAAGAVLRWRPLARGARE